MFDEDDVFENIFAAINVSPKLGDAMFDEDDIFFVPQALMRKFTMMKACLLSMMIIVMTRML